MPSTGSNILQRVASGDASAVAACLDEYGGLVWGLATRYLRGHRSEIEDAVQEVFVGIWTTAARFDPAKGSEAAFVATIAHRRIMDYRRRVMVRKMDRLPEVEPKGVGGAAPGPSRDEAAALGEDFGRLPEDEKTALWMVVGGGMNHREIAAATESPIGTVKTRLRRAVMRLKEWNAVTPGKARAEVMP